jgi:hypothetical protein
MDILAPNFCFNKGADKYCTIFLTSSSALLISISLFTNCQNSLLSLRFYQVTLSSLFKHIFSRFRIVMDLGLVDYTKQLPQEYGDYWISEWAMTAGHRGRHNFSPINGTPPAFDIKTCTTSLNHLGVCKLLDLHLCFFCRIWIVLPLSRHIVQAFLGPTQATVVSRHRCLHLTTTLILR